MTQPGAPSGNRAFFLSPEAPVMGAGGGGLRSASVLEYLRSCYEVDLARFQLPEHSRSTPARVWRNAMRLVENRPPLFDRYSGFEDQVVSQMRGHYCVAVVEHFWCASYADLLRPRADLLVLDMHNVESALAASHARAARWPVSSAFARFATAYERLEQEWLGRFDVILVASEADRGRIAHPNVHVYPNALPEIARPEMPEEDCIVFSGNLEYHPNVEAVEWFRREIWPCVHERCPTLHWRLVGQNPHAIAGLVAVDKGINDERITIVGPVEDAVKELAKAKVCVVPLLSGSGTRFKILEAWAAARAVVSTSIGAEGLNGQPGKHLLVADEPAAFADAIVRLIETPELRASLGEAGRGFYLERYTWRTAWQALKTAGF